jgi:histidyl-tRNA synthetase
MRQLRHHKINSEIFYENSKLEKQFKYAAKKNITYAVINGSTEMEQQTCVIKNISTGEQQTIPAYQIIEFFKK